MRKQKFTLLRIQSTSKVTGYRLWDQVWFPARTFLFITFVSTLSLGTTHGNESKVARMWSWHSLTSIAEFKNMCGALLPKCLHDVMLKYKGNFTLTESILHLEPTLRKTTTKKVRGVKKKCFYYQQKVLVNRVRLILHA